jgi:UDP-N-acetylmuramate: L-alanyl-gamma-D-glutamyl-meso-diaminopimelate ligase
MNIHFISIGGNVMHQLAIALHKKGHKITGSDDEIFDPARGNLAKEGLLPTSMGWNSELITSNLDAVILGMHARENNPELIKAQELALPIYSFPEYIYRESLHKQRIVVGGSHGKTTTTAMIMHALKKCGRDFDFLVGAKLNGFDQSVRITDAPLLICEGDEYPASPIVKKPKFHFLFPHIAIITGIAWDHINVFPTFDIYLEQFAIFIDKIESGGTLIFNQSDPVLNQLVQANPREDIHYQPYHLPQHSINTGITHITLDDASGNLQVFGEHNLLNLQAAWLVCKQLGLSAAEFLQGMQDFTGASKRLELMAANSNTRVYRDFAHAPSKVTATLQALRKQFPQQTLIAVLELHTYSSLNENFLHEYKQSMDGADKAAVFYAAHALELKKLPPLSAEKVLSGFDRADLQVFNQPNQLLIWLTQQDYQNSIVLLMSSGNFDGADMLTFAKTITAS